MKVYNIYSNASNKKQIVKICKTEGCTNERMRHKGFCRICINKQMMKRHTATYVKGKYRKFDKLCSVCGKLYKASYAKQLRCTECCRTRLNLGGANNLQHVNTRRNGVSILKHRLIAENILHRKLLQDECVHHLDHNKQNNDPTNLILIHTKDHSKLHDYLRTERLNRMWDIDTAMLEKEKWLTVVVPITKAWLNINDIKFEYVQTPMYMN